MDARGQTIVEQIDGAVMDEIRATEGKGTLVTELPKGAWEQAIDESATAMAEEIREQVDAEILGNIEGYAAENDAEKDMYELAQLLEYTEKKFGKAAARKVLRKALKAHVPKPEPTLDELYAAAARMDKARDERLRKNALRLRNHQRSEAGKAKRA